MIADDTCLKHLTKQPSKQKVTEPAIECVRIFKSIILAFFFVEIAKNLEIDSQE